MEPFIEVNIAGRWSVRVPEHRAKSRDYENWERRLLLKFAEVVKPGDCICDIGAEEGDQTVAYAKHAGPSNMVVIESNPDNWRNIRATWEANGLPLPRACYMGLLSDATVHMPQQLSEVWPACSLTGDWRIATSYRYIHEHSHQTPQAKMDDLCKALAIEPDVMCIDVEGAELRILAGAVETLCLRNRMMRVFVSIHPELLWKWYRQTADGLHRFMAECGYIGQHIATDHEEHWLFVSE